MFFTVYISLSILSIISDLSNFVSFRFSSLNLVYFSLDVRTKVPNAKNHILISVSVIKSWVSFMLF